MLIYYFPRNWIYEKIDRPTLLTEEKTEHIIFLFKYSHNLKPENVKPSIEGGLIISYFNDKNFRKLEIKICNNLNISAIVFDEKECEIILSEDIENSNFDFILNEFLS